MTSSGDVRDMLDLTGEGTSRPAKKQKITTARPVLKGLAREVQNLGGDNPIAIVPEATVFKKKRFGSKKPAAKWENRPFRNSARGKDADFHLKHWRRKTGSSVGALGDEGNTDQAQDNQQIEDSTFAKFNVQIPRPEYDSDTYKQLLEDANWTEDETRYLLDQCQDFSLRWPLIWDRYEYQAPAVSLDQPSSELAIITPTKSRTMEDLKARYYSVAAAIMKHKKPQDSMNGPEFHLLELMSSFDPRQETARKAFAEAAFHRTKEEAREEESLLIELKRILARSDRLAEERRELYARLEAPASTGTIGVYTTSQGLQQLLHQLMQADKSKKRRSLLNADGNSPAGPSSLTQQGSFDRRDSNVRESISGPSGTNNKKGPPQNMERRQLSEEEEILYGVRHFDRITSAGPAFRAEKINKPITSKSSIQQGKMTSVLVELAVPPRLTMPTFAVGEHFETLLTGISTLLDQRKLADKLTGEINTLKALKQAKEEQAQAATQAENQGDGDTDANKNNVKVEDETGNGVAAGEEAAGGDGKNTASGTGGHKRSASVMSAMSDKSTKRQRK